MRLPCGGMVLLARPLDRSLAEEKDRLVAEVADSIMLAELRDLSSLVSRL